jgi:DEAD/DEAH box helicase domain-containing protein
VDLDNPYIIVDHSKCADFELPSPRARPFRRGHLGTEAGLVEDDPAERLQERAELTAEALGLLEEGGTLRHSAGRWYWADEGYPSEKISLRSALADNVVIVDETGGGSRVIGEMDRPSAKELIFDNAVYIHLGTQYIVKSWISKIGLSCGTQGYDYWTDARGQNVH